MGWKEQRDRIQKEKTENQEEMNEAKKGRTEQSRKQC